MRLYLLFKVEYVCFGVVVIFISRQADPERQVNIMTEHHKTLVQHAYLADPAVHPGPAGFARAMLAGDLFATDDLKDAVRSFLEQGPGHATYKGR